MEEAKIEGMISITLQTQEKKISLQSTMRERLRKMATVVKLHHTTD